MPYSSGEGKDWLTARLIELAPLTVLDVGVGAGTYATLMRPHLPSAWWVGIEIHEPYVERFGLHDLYDQLIIADVRRLSELPAVDVVICGDVLEHMILEDACRVWRRCRAAARKAVFVAIPIVLYPQGGWEDNPYEAHLHTWSHSEVLHHLDGVRDWALGEEIGVYVADPVG